MDNSTYKRLSSDPTGFTLDRLVNETATKFPQRTWVSIPTSSDLSSGWKHITYRQFASAVDGFAQFVERKHGNGDRKTVAAFMGLNDERHTIAVIGLMKAGYIVMLPSPRNSQEHQSSLFDAAHSTCLFYDSRMDRQAEVVRSAKPETRMYSIPSFNELVQQGETRGPYESRCGVDQNDHVLVMHTSGSTGAPKPIFLTNGFLSLLDPKNSLPPPQGRQGAYHSFAAWHGKFFSALPLYHVFGTIVMVRTICTADNLILPSADRPANATAITKILKGTQPNAGAFAPSLLEEACSTDDGLATVAKLQHIFFGGGPLANETGDSLCKLTHLQSIIGSTEAGFIHGLVTKDPLDWQYFEWAPGSGIVMEPAEDGLSELVVKKNGDRTGKGIFYTFPELEEWRTKDLFAPHPEKPGLWTYKGRRDDVIVLSNGEKFNPVGFEKALESLALVRGAVVIGQARFQTALLVEPSWESLADGMDHVSLVDELWPAVERINKTNPSQGRVWKSMILIAKRDKPFVRAAKGSIIRKRTISAYEKEIDTLYGDESTDDKLGKASSDYDFDQTKALLRAAIENKSIPFPASASDDADFFNYGVDSLQVVALSKALTVAYSETRDDQILPQVIYQHPTINTLAKYLCRDSNDDSALGSDISREDIMANMIEEYTKDLQPPAHQAKTSDPQSRTVILTGSTGSLGNYILQNLIASPDVSSIYCMNRSAGAADRNRKSFEERGATPDFAKVTFLQTDFAKDNFNLPQEIYDELLRSADTFIHNAWAVDFNKTVASFEDTHIAGTRRVIDFSAKSQYRAHIVFISSIAGVGNWSSDKSSIANEQVPEGIFEDHSVPLPQGYGESKHVAECMLADAAKQAGIPSTVVRCGQLAGPSDASSVWNRHEWVPSLLISSREMGMIPQTLGNQNVVDWIPMDTAAKAVCEVTIARSTETSQAGDLARAYHVVNPAIVQWTDLVPSISQALQERADKPIQSVPFKSWLQTLESCPVTAGEMEKKPAIKLLDFYNGLNAEGGSLPRLATKDTEKTSEALRSSEAISAELIGTWIQMW
jgi:thioester reductase-like protein